MNKTDLIAALKEKGVTPPDGATNADLEKLLVDAGGDPNPAPKAPAKPKLITVRVLVASLSENGAVYAKGETFETTAERAEALGNTVTTKPAED